MQNKDKYITKDQARTMLENLPKGGTPDGFIDAMKAKGYTFEGLEEAPVVKETTFIDKLKGRLGEAKQGINQAVEGFQDTSFQKSDTTQQAAQQLIQNQQAGLKTSAGLGKIGNAALGVGSDILGTGIEKIADVTGLSSGIENSINSLSPEAQQRIGTAIKTGTEGFNAIAPEGSPQREIANILGNAFNVVGGIEVAQGAKTLAKKGAEMTQKQVDSIAQGLGKKATELGIEPKFAGQIVRSVVANQSGVSPITQDFIKATAKAGKFDEIFSNEILANPRVVEMKTLEDVASNLDDVLSKKGSIGSKYGEVTKSAVPFKFSKQDLVNDVVDSTKLKYDIKKGFYKTLDTANIADSDIAKLNSLLVPYKGAKELNGEQFMVLRDAIKQLAYEGGIKTTAGENIAKKLYSAVNKKYRKNIKGLEELDSQFVDAIDDIQELKGYFTKGADGKLLLKDNAERQLSALLERGNERKLERIKQFIPDIEEKIGYANALRNLDAAQGNLIGNYGKTGGNVMAGVAGGAIGGLPGAVGAFIANSILSNPTNVAKGLGKIYSRGVNQSAKATMNTSKLNSMSETIPQTTEKASGKKMGGFTQITKDNPAYKITPEIKTDLDLIIQSAKDNGKVSKEMFESTLPSLKELFPKEKITASNASDYAKLALSFKDLEKGKLSREAMSEVIKRFEKSTGRKLSGFADLGFLPKLALGTAAGVGAVKLMSSKKEK